MSLSAAQKRNIAAFLAGKIRHKLATYSPETESMPFQVRLLGKDRMVLYSFIHSCSTMLGQSIFEHIGKIIASPHNRFVKDQYKALNNKYISDQAIMKIEQIINELKAASRAPDADIEIREVLDAAKRGQLVQKLRLTVDLFVLSNSGVEYYLELTTAKPNISGFTSLKQKLLRIVAVRGTEGFEGEIHTCVCIPYNPYEPKPYERWTLKGLFDLDKQLFVAEDFWDFLGGDGTYEELLDIFEAVGILLQDQIEEKFEEFR